jgi:hypothetical protein
MDPNACLKEMLKLATTADECGFERLAELVLALDGWLKMGGFLPRRWEGKGTD